MLSAKFIFPDSLVNFTFCLLFLAWTPAPVNSQIACYKLYPILYDNIPAISSPCNYRDSLETIIIVTRDGKYGIAPVTMENGKPLLYSYRLGTFMGKDVQFSVDAGDFPDLAKTGLHREEQLDQKDRITGIPIPVINCTAKPDAYSYAGFMAQDEDLISILKADNASVRSIGLTHPDLARPLFHIWNLLLLEMDLGNWGRFYDHIPSFYYNGHLLNLEASGSKGWQISIFFDEVQGRHNIHIDRELTTDEKNYLQDHYGHLDPGQMDELCTKLTNLNISEMHSYYIMRYGFYEGHTEYRCDPFTVALVFGLRTLQELDQAASGRLYTHLTEHFHQ